MHLRNSTFGNLLALTLSLALVPMLAACGDDGGGDGNGNDDLTPINGGNNTNNNGGDNAGNNAGNNGNTGNNGGNNAGNNGGGNMGTCAAALDCADACGQDQQCAQNCVQSDQACSACLQMWQQCGAQAGCDPQGDANTFLQCAAQMCPDEAMECGVIGGGGGGGGDLPDLGDPEGNRMAGEACGPTEGFCEAPFQCLRMTQDGTGWCTDGCANSACPAGADCSIAVQDGGGNQIAVCGWPCTSDGDCNTGLSCTNLGGGSYCLPPQ